MKQRTIIEVFFRDKPFMILNALRNDNGKINASELARQAKCTYSHARKILVIFEENRLISFNRPSTRPVINLTEKGAQLAEEVEKIKEILKHNGRKY
ncbi:MAG: hypothetical protein AABX63_05345 [Nanoarchaeota archaeon]